MNISVDFRQEFTRCAKNILTVNFSTGADLGDIVRFYTDHRHKHVDARPVSVFEKAASEGRMILFRDAEKKLVASSSAYDFSDDDELPSKWVEIGSTRSILKGFNLYPFIIAAQVVSESAKRPPGEMFVANIYDDNVAVQNILEHTNGWHRFTPCKGLVDVTGLADDMDRLVWLKSTPDCLKKQIGIVSAVIERGYVESKKTGERLGLRFDGFPMPEYVMPRFP
jgi:hypothetical protein